MTLYNLSEDMRALIEMLEEDQENEAIQQTIEMMLFDLEDKAEATFYVIRQLEADAEMAKSEKMRLGRKQSAAENGAKRMREALKSAMLLTGKTKIKRPTCTISITKRMKAFVTAEPEALPEEFKKVTVEARTADIEKWLKEGNEADWAHLEQVEGLTIR